LLAPFQAEATHGAVRHQPRPAYEDWAPTALRAAQPERTGKQRGDALALRRRGVV
jgi:hypothetical protein